MVYYYYYYYIILLLLAIAASCLIYSVEAKNNVYKQQEVESKENLHDGINTVQSNKATALSSSNRNETKELIEQRLQWKITQIFPPGSGDRLRDLVLRNHRGIEGNNQMPRIVGGKEVSPEGKYPFMVGGYDGNIKVCGASLIAPSYVLCAAHCAPYVTYVRIGLHNTATDEDYESFKVIGEIKHPNYNANTMSNDFMVLELNGESKYTPVLLDDGSANLNKSNSLTVIGWGSIFTNGPTSRKLLEAQVFYVSNSDCNSFNSYNGAVLSNMMCATAPGKDACQGDSGGPLIVTGSNTQVGVVSWGYNCASPRFPGVYSRISSAYAWIMSVISGQVPLPTPPTPAPPSALPGCKDVEGWIDTYDDTCSWYTQNDPGCVDWWNTQGSMGLNANQACCECGGGSTGTGGGTSPSNPSSCTDQPSWIDKFGDSCSWYAANDPGCAKWHFTPGSSGLTAAQACCECGGGFQSSPNPGACSDYAEWKSQLGKSCDFFNKRKKLCKQAVGGVTGSSNGSIKAKEACCSCGGGVR